MRRILDSSSAVRWVGLAVTLLLCATLWAADGEKETLEGRRVVRIDVDVPADVDATRVREVIRARVGDAYTPAAVEKDVAALYGLGEYTEIRVERKRLGEGVHLTYRMKRRAVIRSIAFEGDLRLSEDDLRGALDVSVGEPMVPYRLKLSIENLRSHYREAGYVFAHIEERRTETDEGVELAYTISAGARLNVEAVQFEGNEAISDRELRKLMESMTPGGLFGQGGYRPELLRSDLLALGEAFRRKGYLDATVGHEIVYDEAKERAYVLIRVRQGTLYTVERIVIRGAELFTTAQIIEVMTLAEGGTFSQELIDEALREIGRLYGRQGHVKAQTTVDRVFSEEAPSVTLRLTIIEGPKCTVNRVIIRGNHLTKDNVVRREVTLLPGDLANTDEIEETRRRLYNTGLFFVGREAAGEDPVAIRLLDTDDPTKSDVLIELMEGRPGILEVGGGWSSSVGIAGNLTITHRNFDATDFPKSWSELRRREAFVGAGQRLVLSLSPGAHYRDYRLSWLDPSVLDSPYQAGFDLYLQDYRWRTADYDESRAGVALRFGREFIEDLLVTVVPRFENIDISGVDPAASADALAAAGDHTRRSVAVTVDYDKRDSRWFTTTGYRVQGSLERGGALLLGGDLEYLREIIEARHWWTVRDQPGWGKHVLNVGGEIAMIQDTGSDDILIFDRFFAGGLGSLRGFEHRGVGPVDPVTGDHVGGECRIVLNTEYEFPLTKDTLWDSKNTMRGVVFVDAGTLESTLSDLSLSRLRVSAGVGIRLRLPVLGLQELPMGFYVATPIRDETTDDTESFSFSIGTGFEF